MLRLRTRAQNILEYAVVFAIVSAALVTMQLYSKRGIQALVKLATDQMAGQKKGVAEKRVENNARWVIKEEQDINSFSSSTKNVSYPGQGAVVYETEEATSRSGRSSHGVAYELE